jgi:hypothetical protein
VGVSPAVPGASRSRRRGVFLCTWKHRSTKDQEGKRARARCPCHSGRDARATSNASVPSTALGDRGDVKKVIEHVDHPALAAPWVWDQQTANGQNVFGLFPAYRLAASTRYLLTAFLFNNIPALSD